MMATQPAFRDERFNGYHQQGYENGFAPQQQNGYHHQSQRSHHKSRGGGQGVVKELCYRCKRPTYFNDKMGPVKDGTLFHKGCFKCWICGTRLTLKTYFNNRNDTQDLEIYCSSHAPAPGPHDPIPHRSNLVYSPKTQGKYSVNMLPR